MTHLRMNLKTISVNLGPDHKDPKTEEVQQYSTTAGIYLFTTAPAIPTTSRSTSAGSYGPSSVARAINSSQCHRSAQQISEQHAFKHCSVFPLFGHSGVTCSPSALAVYTVTTQYTGTDTGDTADLLHSNTNLTLHNIRQVAHACIHFNSNHQRHTD